MRKVAFLTLFYILARVTWFVRLTQHLVFYMEYMISVHSWQLKCHELSRIFHELRLVLVLAVHDHQSYGSGELWYLLGGDLLVVSLGVFCYSHKLNIEVFLRLLAVHLILRRDTTLAAQQEQRRIRLKSVLSNVLNPGTFQNLCQNLIKTSLFM